MSLIIGILQTANSRSRCAHAHSKLPPTQSGPGSQIVNLSGNSGVDLSCIVFPNSLRVFADVAVVKKLHRAGFKLAAFYALIFRSRRHPLIFSGLRFSSGLRRSFGLKVRFPKSASTCFFLSTARLISLSGISRSFVRPCESTTTALTEKIRESCNSLLTACPQFADSIPEEVCLRPAEFVPHLGEARNSLRAFCPGLPRKLVEPEDQGELSVAIFEKINFGWDQLQAVSLFSLLRTLPKGDCRIQ